MLDSTRFERLSRQRYESLLPQIKLLFASAFGRQATPNVLEWRYLQNPRSALLACIAKQPESDLLAASYSACPIDLVVHGKQLRSAMSMTTMTSPDFAGQGLFVALASMLYDQLRSEEYDLVWGFPNANSHRGFVSKLKWRDIYEIPTMSVDMDALKNAQLPNVEDAVYFDERFEQDYDGIARKSTSHLMIHRTNEYLRWRYRDHPENEYLSFCTKSRGEVSSYCVIKMFGASEIDIVDLIVSTADEMLMLVAKVVSIARVRLAKRINAWAPRHHFCHSVYEKLGFRLSAPVTYFGALMLSEKRAKWSDVTNYSNWYLQMGDSDVF